jgi:hypothetical protein
MWFDQLAPTSRLDSYLRLAVTIFLAIWLFVVGTKLETPYPAPLVEAYALPITRLFLLFLVILSAIWCPTVGILAALAYVCLGADVLSFTHGAQVIATSKSF